MFQAPASTVRRETPGETKSMRRSVKRSQRQDQRGQRQDQRNLKDSELIAASDSPAVRFTAVMFQAAASTVRRETPGETRVWCHLLTSPFLTSMDCWNRGVTRDLTTSLVGPREIGCHVVMDCIGPTTAQEGSYACSSKAASGGSAMPSDTMYSVALLPTT